MKNKYLILILIVISMGCRQEDNNSDAFGNFETNPVIISAEATGKVINFTPKQGKLIEEGAVVGLIDTTQLDLKRRQLKAQKDAVNSRRSSIHAQILVFEEQIKNLKTNKSRIEKLLKDGAATSKQHDDISGQISVIEKQIESTRTQYSSVLNETEVINSQINILNDQLQRCFIKNPVKGTVLETFVEEGEITAAGRALYKIADTDKLILKVYISGSILASVQIGQEVKVIIDKSETENDELTGIITWISPEAEFTPKIIQTKEERVKLVYAVKIIVNNDGRLKIGMPGEVKL